VQRSRRRSTARAALGLVIAALLALPGAPPAGAGVPAATNQQPDIGLDGSGAADLPDGPLEPSAQYLDALAHAGDRIDFAPGARVSVPFRPRVGDAWPVGGGSARALPAGRLSGGQMRAADAAGGDAAGGDAAGGDATSGEEAGPAADLSAADAPTTTASLPRAETAAAVSSTGLHRAVLGFLPYWEVSDSSTTLDYTTLSTIAYFSVGCASGGTLLKKNADGSTTTGWAGWTSSKMTSNINAAHSAGTRVVLTLTCFAWSSSGAALQQSILTSSSYRTNLAKEVAKAVRDRGADGVNLDFEPLVSGTESGFVAFVKAVRGALDAYAPGYELTFDTMGRIGNYPIAQATAPGAADALMIMGYDYRTASSSSAGSISPLTGPPYDLNDTIAAFTKQVPASKLLLGVPYYGRAWSTDSDALHAKNISGTKYGASVNVTYGSAIGFAAEYGRRWDDIEQAPWTAYTKQTCTATYGCVTSWRELYYDDAASLGRRYDLVNRAGLRGAGIWALGYDGARPELYRMLADKFLRDTTPPLTGVANLAWTQLDEGFKVAWASYDDSAVAGYDVQVSTDGGAWSTWLSGTTRTTDVFLGSTGHTYAFRVRATDSAGNTSAWYDAATTSLAAPASLAVGSFATVTYDGLRMRASASTSATIMTTLPKGSVLYVTGGPKSSNGYTWYRVNGPIRQWATVDFAQLGGWVAATDGSSSYVVPRSAPHATRVAAGLRGYAVAAGGDRVLSPGGTENGTIRLSWTNATALDSLTLRVFSSDGSLVGSRSLNRLAAGAQAFDWDGTLGGVPVGTGNYVAQLVGLKGSTTYTAPSASPVTAAQLLRYGIAVAAMPPTEVFAFKPTTASPTRSGMISYALVFGGPVSGLTKGDFSRTGTATGCSIGSPSGSGASYTISVSSCSAGTVTLALKANAVSDAVGNGGPAAATAAPTVVIDRTAPTTTVPRTGLRAGLTYNGSPLAARLTWTGSDSGGAGIASYDIERSVDGGAFKVIASGLTSASLNVALSSGHTYRFAVRARDRAGNVGAWKAGATTSTLVRQDTSGYVGYSSGWHKASSTSFSGGAVHYATAAGASARSTFSGRSVAIVATVGPTRGQVKVYLDGGYVTTIDTYATTWTARQVVWSRTWSSAGTHAIRLVVVGTAGRPRVDLDALLVLR
jgi:spore germination protein YaaH